MTFVTLSSLGLVLMAWGTVAFSVAALMTSGPPEDTTDDGPYDDGIPPEDDPSGPEIDWGTWYEMDTKEKTMV